MTLDEYYSGSTVVFVGTVIGLNEWTQSEFVIRTPAMLRVKQRYKGEPLPRAVVVHTHPSPGLDGYQFRLGEETLVFAKWAEPDSGEAPYLFTSACYGTREVGRMNDTEREWLRALN